MTVHALLSDTAIRLYRFHSYLGVLVFPVLTLSFSLFYTLRNELLISKKVLAFFVR